MGQISTSTSLGLPRTSYTGPLRDRPGNLRGAGCPLNGSARVPASLIHPNLGSAKSKMTALAIHKITVEKTFIHTIWLLSDSDDELLPKIDFTSIGGVVTIWESEKSDRITTPVGYAWQIRSVLQQQAHLMRIGLEIL